MKTIKIGEKEYPVRVTMGAIREYKKLSGKEVEQISGSSDVGEFLHSCAVSTCRAEKIEFTLNVDEFTDQLEISYAGEVFTEILANAGFSTLVTDGSKKKSR